MRDSLYINGVFENVLEEICTAQSSVPDLVCYLQPYSSSAINELQKSPPTENSPMRVYFSTTALLSCVSYRAEIVGWEKKADVSVDRLAELNEHISHYQPGETEIYMEVKGKPAVNLISVRNMERLATPIPVSSFIKTSNDEPLKPRTRSGGWSYVKPLPGWVGAIPVTSIEVDFFKAQDDQVTEALNRPSESRSERLRTAPKIPEPVQVISKAYRRNADVIAEVLLRASGVCEHCHKAAPFRRARDNSPYLEVHHKIMLAEGGEDTVENAIAVCPNCHRELHFGI